MGKEIPLEVRFNAEELYVVDGLTYDRVAAITGVSVSQLKRWGSEGDWAERKSEYREALTSIRRDTVLLRKNLIEKAMNSLDPQAVYAVARLEAVAAKVGGTGQAQEGGAGMTLRTIKTPQDAVAALSEVVEKKINAMLTQPNAVSLAGIKEIKQALDLIEKMQEKYIDDEKGSPGKKKQIDPETLKTIKEEIYGL